MSQELVGEVCLASHPATVQEGRWAHQGLPASGKGSGQVLAALNLVHSFFFLSLDLSTRPQFSPALLEAAASPGEMPRACHQDWCESQSSDRPLRHGRLFLQPRAGFFLFFVFFALDWLCGFYKLSSFILFQKLVFEQGENLQEGNFPLGWAARFARGGRVGMAGKLVSRRQGTCKSLHGSPAAWIRWTRRERGALEAGPQSSLSLLSLLCCPSCLWVPGESSLLASRVLPNLLLLALPGRDFGPCRDFLVAQNNRSVSQSWSWESELRVLAGWKVCPRPLPASVLLAEQLQHPLACGHVTPLSVSVVT
jgi:hypothetical protein